eukprot:scaffold107872_cov51-Attheya_sp.AAC.1
MRGTRLVTLVGSNSKKVTAERSDHQTSKLKCRECCWFAFFFWRFCFQLLMGRRRTRGSEDARLPIQVEVPNTTRLALARWVRYGTHLSEAHKEAHSVVLLLPSVRHSVPDRFQLKLRRNWYAQRRMRITWSPTEVLMMATCRQAAAPAVLTPPH